MLKSFRDLKAWQIAWKLSCRVEELTKTWPPEEKYRLTDQIIRSSRSTGDNLAEGFGRYHFNDKLKFYGDAKASLEETEGPILKAQHNAYLSAEEAQELFALIQEDRYLINRLITNLRTARDRWNQQARAT
jgi:four helix bundle protein